jgi:hypothetical protein
MATAGIYNFVIDQGATYTLQMVYQDGAGNPINLTGYTAKMQLRLKFGAPDAALTLTTENGGITINGPTGTINLLATDEQTLALDPLLYLYDLDIITGGTIERLIMGQITVRPEVTINA